MLHVGLLSHSPHVCGAERMLLNLAVGLKKRGRIAPRLFIPAPQDGNLATMAASHGIACEEAPSTSWFYNETKESQPSYWTRTVAQAAAYRNVLERHALDAVVVNTLTSLPPALAAMKLQIPFVAWIHGIADAALLQGPSPLSRLCEKLTLRAAAQIVTCSEWTARHFRYRTDPERITAILNWTDVPACPPADRPATRRFACLSTLEKHKGIDLAIRAMAWLRSRGQSCELDIYASGLDELSYRQLVRELRLDRDIRFLGRTNNVAEVYRNSLATLFPSRVESFGMLAIESMAQRTPVIASRIGGLPEIIDDGETGMLFERDNVEQMAACMQRLLDDPAEARQLGEAGYRRVLSRFNGDVSLPQFESVLSSAAASLPPHESELWTDLLETVGGIEQLPVAAASAGLPPSDRYHSLATFAREANNFGVLDMARVMAGVLRQRGFRRMAGSAWGRADGYVRRKLSGLWGRK